jgi:hypothetical protein
MEPPLRIALDKLQTLETVPISNLPDRELTADGLTLLRWERYEAESYLLHPASLQRFLESELPAGAGNEARGIAKRVGDKLTSIQLVVAP